MSKSKKSLPKSKSKRKPLPSTEVQKLQSQVRALQKENREYKEMAALEHADRTRYANTVERLGRQVEKLKAELKAEKATNKAVSSTIPKDIPAEPAVEEALDTAASLALEESEPKEATDVTILETGHVATMWHEGTESWYEVTVIRAQTPEVAMERNQGEVAEG